MTDVVHVVAGIGTGGAEAMLTQVASALQARGMSQHVVGLTALDAHAGDLQRGGVGVTILGARSPAAIPAILIPLMRVVNAHRPRILQGWMYHGDLAASLCHCVCRGRAQRRLMWNLRASNMDARRYGRLIRLSGLVSGSVDVAVANSRAGADFHRARGMRPKRVVEIDNGIDTVRFRPDPVLRGQVRAELGIADDAVVTLHVARVDAMKDHPAFLAAMAEAPALLGILVGKDTENLTLPPNVRALGLRRDTERLYAAADIVVSSSAFGEGFSNVIAEGMSAGLLPVATDVGDARRIVGDTGSIVPPGDARALAVALRAAAGWPAEERRRRGLAARDRIAANFTVGQAVDAFARLYAPA